MEWSVTTPNLEALGLLNLLASLLVDLAVHIWVEITPVFVAEQVSLPPGILHSLAVVNETLDHRVFNLVLAILVFDKDAATVLPRVCFVGSCTAVVLVLDVVWCD